MKAKYKTLDADAPLFHLPPHYRGPLIRANSIGSRNVQWWTSQFGLEDWWNRGIDGSGVVVVVVDTGYDPVHGTSGDLAGQIVGSVDGTGQGINDTNQHSTHCCGIIGAIRNGKGVVGVAPGVKIVTAKGLRDNGSGSGNSLSRAYDLGCQEAFKHASIGVVTSNSYGGSSPIRVLDDVMQRWHAKGVLASAAAGNDGSENNVDEPAAGAFALAVGADDEQGKVASFSDRGPEVDLVAPGVQILSTIPGGDYARFSGTSMATPWVAGAIALRLQAEYKLTGSVKTKTMDQLAALLDLCCEDRGTPGRDHSYGRGRLNMDKWLTVGLTPTQPPPSGKFATVVEGGKPKYVPL